MKIKATSQVVNAFKPITLTITFDTPEEARALRAVQGGVDPELVRNIVTRSSWNEGVTEDLVTKVLFSIGRELELQLKLQGEFK